MPSSLRIFANPDYRRIWCFGLLSGTVFAEIIFSRPGVGKIIYDMVLARNFPVVQGAVLVTIALYVVVTLIADLVVSWLDPRVRESL